jgi:hypothetical protein
LLVTTRQLSTTTATTDQPVTRDTRPGQVQATFLIKEDVQFNVTVFKQTVAELVSSFCKDVGDCSPAGSQNQPPSFDVTADNVIVMSTDQSSSRIVVVTFYINIQNGAEIVSAGDVVEALGAANANATFAIFGLTLTQVSAVNQVTTPVPTEIQTPGKDGGLSNGEILGIIFAVVGAAILLVSLLAIIKHRQTKRKVAVSIGQDSEDIHMPPIRKTDLAQPDATASKDMESEDMEWTEAVEV